MLVALALTGCTDVKAAGRELLAELAVELPAPLLSFDSRPSAALFRVGNRAGDR